MTMEDFAALLTAYATIDALVVKVATEQFHPDEDSARDHFTATGQVLSPLADQWHGLIRRTTRRNVTVRRLIVLTNDLHHLSLHERFVLAGGIGNHDAGEEVHVAWRGDLPPLTHGLWLLDHKHLIPLAPTAAGRVTFGVPHPAAPEDLVWNDAFAAHTDRPGDVLARAEAARTAPAGP